MPGPARLEILYAQGGAVADVARSRIRRATSSTRRWSTPREGGPRSSRSAARAAIVKLWQKSAGRLRSGETLWQKDFGGKFSRMRDAEIGGPLRRRPSGHRGGDPRSGRGRGAAADGRRGFTAVELDREPDTFVHEIEIGDLDGDGALEIYATPSEPNRLDGGRRSSGHVVRYVPAQGRRPRRSSPTSASATRRRSWSATSTATGATSSTSRSKARHRGRQASSSSRWRSAATTRARPPNAGEVIATHRRPPLPLPHRRRRGRRRQEGDRRGGFQQRRSGCCGRAPTRRASGRSSRSTRDSSGFEHAALLTDLDGDGSGRALRGERRPKQVRRYVWDGRKLAREVI